MPVAETSHIAVRCGVIAAPLPYIVNTTAHRFPSTAALSSRGAATAVSGGLRRGPQRGR